MDNGTLDIWFKFILALAVIIGPIVQIWIQTNSAKKAENKVDQVAETLKAVEVEKSVKVDSLAAIVQETHRLVNGNMGAQLKLSAEALRELADLEKTPVAEAAAVAAETTYAEHLKSAEHLKKTSSS